MALHSAPSPGDGARRSLFGLSLCSGAGGLDFFPTPPWATRALCQHIATWGDPSTETAWDPACGQGHMIRPLTDYFAEVHGTDVHDYGQGRAGVHDFLMPFRPAGLDGDIDWIITNPPFRLAGEFVHRALDEARTGVAMLVRTTFLEGAGRFESLFSRAVPEWILQFCERVPMLRARLDEKASSATAYCWIVWVQPTKGLGVSNFPAFVWIPPCRRQLERLGDYDAQEDLS